MEILKVFALSNQSDSPWLWSRAFFFFLISQGLLHISQAFSFAECFHILSPPVHLLLASHTPPLAIKQTTAAAEGGGPRHQMRTIGLTTFLPTEGHGT